MEKQPIDDFFARKLREAEQLPSPDTFSRLQSRMVSTELPKKQRRAALWWYSAAAASLLLVTLFIYRNHVKPVNNATEQVAKLKRIEKTRMLSPIQKASQLMATAGKELLSQRSAVLEKEEGRGKRGETLLLASAKQVTAQKGIVATVTIAQKLPEPKPKIEQKPALLSPAFIEQEAIAIAPRLPLPIYNAQPPGPVTARVTDPQRVVVLTIDVPTAEVPIVALQATKAEAMSQAQSGNLAGLFAKMKQLKNGDMLARATPAKRLTESRSRLGRVFEGMKESLKNETTLD